MFHCEQMSVFMVWNTVMLLLNESDLVKSIYFILQSRLKTLAKFRIFFMFKLKECNTI